MDGNVHAVMVRGVTKAYRQGERDVLALRGVNLDVGRGEFLAIMGASGSGKSTLLHLCAALDRPTSGTIMIGGEPLEKLGEKGLTQFRRRKIGVVFQQFNLIPTLTCRENIALPALLDGSFNGEHERHIQKLLELLRIDHRAEHRPDAMSGGEQQRTAIARALIMRPPVVFADEPTGNLDSASAQQFWETLDEAVGEFKTTIMMVTHEPAVAMHADRVVVLRDGLIAGEFLTRDCGDATALAGSYQAMAK